MARDDKTPSEENSGTEPPGKFAGEEEVDEWASPQKNLAATAVIALISIAAIVLAVDLPRPDNILTAAGLLPVLTGVSLLAMAGALGFMAIRDGRLKQAPLWGGNVFGQTFENEESRRVLMLVGIVFIYIVLLDLITFDLRFPTPFYTFRFSTYECVSIPVIALILRIFWRATVLRCSIVSLVTILFLATVFRDGFKILLPGAD